ncbi:hypothetical protein MLW09_24090 [Escherichia coli]|uniref:hypothetical protein n=1 Tax=Escherichia coli TaxID=562 RepID=UPI000A98CB3F|nr:hypothetical protein [Escherichia coli]MCN5240963.1 hypothetical protein [Escherichia coli]MCN9925601.1 hypothetical protein [Escherichia coli]MDK6572115.1 hypothetical protein [Escherichia coli]
MNARKAVLADNPELILRVLQLRFDESLSVPAHFCADRYQQNRHFFSGEAISPGIH